MRRRKGMGRRRKRRRKKGRGRRRENVNCLNIHPAQYQTGPLEPVMRKG